VRDAVHANLLYKYQEVVVGRGLVSGQSVVLEILANPTTGTWTILATNQNNVSCVVAAGRNWQEVEKQPGDPET
jgi:hypothetical protein